MTVLLLPPLCRALLCSFCLVLLLLHAINFLAALRQKQRLQITVSVLLFLLTYGILQILSSVISYKSDGSREMMARFFGSISSGLLLVAVVLLALAGGMLLRSLILWNRSHISQRSVKESIDNLPSGLAFYREDGSCLLVNHTMDRLGICLTGNAVLDGRELEHAAAGQEMLVEMDGRKYHFSHRILDYKESLIHELVADDVTELYEKTLVLREANAELAELSRKMKQYQLTIDETVRKQEILQAKIQIHDEMNRLLLATDNASEGLLSEEDLQTILLTWKNNALLLCKEADLNSATNTEKDLETLSGIIGIKIRWEGQLRIREAKVLQLFEMATREALHNAAKHANANRLHIKLESSEHTLSVSYSNDGLAPAGEVRPSGGLKDLKQMLEKSGGSMSVSSAPVFTLHISIPIGGEENGL